MQDMLTKQLMGRFRSHKLSVQTVLTPQVAEATKFDVEGYLKREMVTQLAHGIMHSNNHATWTVGDESPGFLGKPIRVETYCLTEEKFQELIKTAFDAGVESCWRKEDEQYDLHLPR
jgi:hypothetical protein